MLFIKGFIITTKNMINDNKNVSIFINYSAEESYFVKEQFLRNCSNGLLKLIIFSTFYARMNQKKKINW